MGQRLFSIGSAVVLVLWATLGCDAREAGPRPSGASVIFVHPDGAGASAWSAARMLYASPDGQLNWDRLPQVAVYREHVADSVTSTSNAGGTVHAFGVKVAASSYGNDGGKPITDKQGKSRSVMHQALAAGFSVGLVNSGSNTEPGTGCFLASVPNRNHHEDIARQLVESGARVIMGGGERWFVPADAQGRHGAGARKDGLDLVAEAKKRGYTVVYDQRQLKEAAQEATKLLGLFAHKHTFNDQTEEQLRNGGLPAYHPGAPTLAQMTDAALKVLDRSQRPFMLVVEEEGTDNFANVNNARDTLLAVKRADDAIGVALKYLDDHPKTLLLTAADSNAGGLHVAPMALPSATEARTNNGAPMDGAQGTNTEPFVTKRDKLGNRHRFAVIWSTLSDCSGGVVARAAGFNAHLVRGSFDNTDVAKVMRATLFEDQGQ